MGTSTTGARRKPAALAAAAPDHISRRALAEQLQLHPDSLSRNMPSGLASAVIRWGGHGKEMVFSRRLALRWDGARKCNKFMGRPCFKCSTILDDAETLGQHHIETRHGLHGCAECAEGAPAEPSWPCSSTSAGA